MERGLSLVAGVFCEQSRSFCSSLNNEAKLVRIYIYRLDTAHLLHNRTLHINEQFLFHHRDGTLERINAGMYFQK